MYAEQQNQNASPNTLNLAGLNSVNFQTYSPELNSLTGSMSSGVFLSRVVHWWRSRGGAPFWKHNEGDPSSWVSQEGFTINELRTARKVVATRVKKSQVAELSAITPAMLTEEVTTRTRTVNGEARLEVVKRSIKGLSRLVLYWRNGGGKIWYRLNEPLLVAILMKYREPNRDNVEILHEVQKLYPNAPIQIPGDAEIDTQFDANEQVKTPPAITEVAAVTLTVDDYETRESEPASPPDTPRPNPEPAPPPGVTVLPCPPAKREDVEDDVPIPRAKPGDSGEVQLSSETNADKKPAQEKKRNPYKLAIAYAFGWKRDDGSPNDKHGLIGGILTQFLGTAKKGKRADFNIGNYTPAKIIAFALWYRRVTSIEGHKRESLPQTAETLYERALSFDSISATNMATWMDQGEHILEQLLAGKPPTSKHAPAPESAQMPIPGNTSGYDYTPDIERMNAMCRQLGIPEYTEA